MSFSINQFLTKSDCIKKDSSNNDMKNLLVQYLLCNCQAGGTTSVPPSQLLRLRRPAKTVRCDGCRQP